VSVSNSIVSDVYYGLVWGQNPDQLIIDIGNNRIQSGHHICEMGYVGKNSQKIRLETEAKLKLSFPLYTVGSFLHSLSENKTEVHWLY